MGLSTAERQARHRARLAEAQAQAHGQGALILATLDTLTRAVEALAGEVRAMRTPGGYPGQNGGKPAQSVTSRGPKRDGSLRNGEGAPARTWEGAAPPLRGADGARPTDDDAHHVLVALTRPASAGGISDALSAIGRDLSLARVSAALVHLQGQGQVRRTPGVGAAPDTWEAVEDAHLGDLADAPIRPRTADQGPTLHVECSDYQAHVTAHRWDGALGAFVCDRCIPTHGALAVPPGRGATPPQEVPAHA